MRTKKQPQRRIKPYIVRAAGILGGIVLMVIAPTALLELPTDQNSPLLTLGQGFTRTSVDVEPPRGSVQMPSAIELERAVTQAAQQHHLHPALLFAVMKAESSFNPIVVSKAGAVGLMQLVPETALRHGVRNLYDTNENVAGGARHLRYLLDRFHGNTRLALAAYNAGERNVDRYKQIPPYKETRHYVQKVLSYYRDYRKEARFVPAGERYQEGYRIRKL
jgi:soluble lytic murein transglycosylase-like protein